MATYHENLVQSFENFKDRYIDYEPRNYFPFNAWELYDFSTVWVNSGVTFTVSEDGVITASGTSTAEITIALTDLVYCENNYDIPGINGKILSLTGTNLANFGLTIDYYYSYWGVASLDESVNINDDEDHVLQTDYKVQFKLHVNNGVTLDNDTLSIMLRDSSVEDNTYYPIAKPNSLLTLETNTLGSRIESMGNKLYNLKADNGLAYYESGNTASRYYSIGAYIITESGWYKVIKTIARNATFIKSGENANLSWVFGTILSNNDAVHSKHNANFATEQTTSTAVQAYAIGDLIVWNYMLYKATEAIAQGDTLKTGTNANVVRTTIAEELANVTPQESLKVQTIGRQPKDITDMLDDLSDAIAEQDLEKYGYVIGDWFIGDSGYYYYLADMDPFYVNSNFYSYYSLGPKINIHHIGVVVRPPSTVTTKYHDTDNDGTFAGYSTSTLHNLLTTTVLNAIKDDYDTLFGDWSEHLLAHCKCYNTISGWAWSSGTVGSYGGTEYISALTEAQVTGCTNFSNNQYQQGEGFKQLELFRRYYTGKVFGDSAFHLRSLFGNTSSVIVASDIYITYHGVNSSALRVAALILMK